MVMLSGFTFFVFSFLFLCVSFFKWEIREVEVSGERSLMCPLDFYLAYLRIAPPKRWSSQPQQKGEAFVVSRIFLHPARDTSNSTQPPSPCIKE